MTATLKHLRILEQAGLVATVKVGRERRCRVQTEALADVERWIVSTRHAWTFRLDSLESYLKEAKSMEEKSLSETSLQESSLEMTSKEEKSP